MDITKLNRDVSLVLNANVEDITKLLNDDWYPKPENADYDSTLRCIRNRLAHMLNATDRQLARIKARNERLTAVS